jgi:hypothetical protein
MLEQLEREPGYYADYYPPLKWALNKGYAKALERGSRFEITDAGRDILRSLKGSL